MGTDADTVTVSERRSFVGRPGSREMRGFGDGSHSIGSPLTRLIGPRFPHVSKAISYQFSLGYPTVCARMTLCSGRSFMA
jgi:hypothetical protein